MGKKNLSNKDKKEWAKLIFLKEHKTQKEIAATVGVSEVTMSKWVKEWEHLKLNLLQTREERLASTLIQLANLDKAIAEVGFPDSKQADIRRKLTADLEALEQEASIRDVVEVGKRILAYVRPLNAEQAAIIGAVFDDYIKHLLSKK